MANDYIQSSLFDDEQAKKDIEQRLRENETGGKILNDLQRLDQLSKLADTFGVYYPYPGESIIKRSSAYYHQNIGTVESFLKSSGMSAETVATVKRDYLLAMGGYYDFVASLEQISEAVDKIDPVEAFMIDKYGFFWLLYRQYRRYGKTTVYYLENIKDGDKEAKNEYLETKAKTYGELKAIDWAMKKGYIRLYDFADAPRQAIGVFATMVRTFGELQDYGEFYHFAKYALLSTTEELDQIKKPNGLYQIDDYESFAKDYGEDTEQLMNETASNFAKAREAATKIAAELENARDDNHATNKPATLSLKNKLLSIQSRGIYGVKSGEIKGGILPIKTYITKFLKREGITTPVSSYQIEQAIDGINIMAMDKPGVRPINGYYTYQTNLTEFSRYCGLVDANDTTRHQLFHALQVIDFTGWLVVWEAKGPAKVRVLTVTKISATGEFTVNVTEEAMKGRPTLVTQEGYEKLRAETKGQPKAHFRNQMLIKGHKEETELIKECWDYQTRLDLAAERGDAEKEKFQKEWKNRRSRYKAQLREWFKEYAANGAIVYKVTEKNGKRFYEWRKGKLLTPPDDNNIVTDAEIVGDTETNGAEQAKEGATDKKAAPAKKDTKKGKKTAKNG